MDNKHVYVFVRKKKKYCGPITKMYGCAMCILFFPVVCCLPFCPCDEKTETTLRNKNSLDQERKTYKIVEDEFMFEPL
tara:strand:+ start:2517 stop:2750 length:234 start_codon:yes stop_codon:yes gene_type:complete